jgi:hypothetical protein
MKRLRRPDRNRIERETAKPRVSAEELRHHDPFERFEPMSEAALARLRTA